MHDLTDSVIRDRKAEYKYGKMMLKILSSLITNYNFREAKINSNGYKDTNMEDELVGKKKLAFLGMYKLYNKERYK